MIMMKIPWLSHSSFLAINMVSFWSIMLCGEKKKKTCKVGILSLSQCFGGIEKKKEGGGRG
jgi:hypothetical protein